MPKKDFRNKNFLITAGATREYLDPVRFITNASSGKMGLALAEAAQARKGKVIFITASQAQAKDLPRTTETHGCKPPHQCIGDGGKAVVRGLPFKVIPVETAREMFKEVKANFLKADIIIMAAAVADFRPQSFQVNKIRKEREPEIFLKLVRNPDILSWLGKNKGRRITVGFSVETEDEENRAKKKLKEKNADLIIAVNLRQKGGVVGKNFAQVKLVERNGLVTSFPRLRKKLLAHLILDRILKTI